MFSRAKSLLCVLVFALAFLGAGCTAKARAARHAKRGDDYYAKSEWDKAKLEYLNAVRKGARDPRVLSRLGECFLKAGEIGPAYEMLSRAIASQPTNSVARQTVGSLLLAFGNKAKAHEQADAILKFSPGDPQGVILLAQSCSTPQESAASKKQIEQLQASSPTQSAYPFALGLLAIQANDRDTARTLLQKAISLDPKKGQYHLALANFARNTGDIPTADASFKSAIALAPIKSWDRLQYAEFLEDVGRQDDAEKFLTQTVAQAPDFSRAINDLTELLLARGKLDQGEKYNQQALAISQTDRDALLNRARLKHLRGDEPGALADLQELSRTRAKDATVQYHLGLAYLANNDIVKALGALDQAVTLDPKNVKAVIVRSDLQMRRGDYNAAIPELNRILRDSPGLVNARLLLASAYRLRGTPAEALPIYSALAKALPKDARPVFFTGQTYRELRKPAEARDAFNKTLEIQPDHVGSVEELTQLDLQEGKGDNALARLHAFEQKFPKSARLYHLEARVFLTEKKPDEAIRLLQKSLEIAPDFEPAQRTLVDVYVQTGKRAEATERLTAMLKKNPKDAASLLQLGILQDNAKDFKAAQASYEAVLKLNPNNVAALNNLAALLSERMHNPDAALEYAKRAHDLAPNEPYSTDTYGWIFFRKGDYSRALTALQDAAQKLPGIAEVQCHFGMALYMTGASESAAAVLSKAVQDSSDYAGKDDARRVLTVLKIDPAKASPEEIQALKDALKAQPADFVAQLRLAQIMEQQKQWDQASQNYDAAIKLNPRATNTIAHLAELNCFQLGNPARGLELAKQAWNLSQEGDLAAVVGPIAYAAGDFKWASALLSSAARARPDDSRIAFYRASADYASGNLSAAQSEYRDIQGSGFQSALAKQAVDLIGYQLGSGDPAAAATASAAALKADSNFAPALVVSGLLAETKKDYPGARAAYEKVLKTAPTNVPARRQLGLLLTNNFPEDQKATELLTAVKSDLPGDAQISKALGKLAYRRSDYSEAVRSLRDASLRLKNDSDLLYHLGMAQYQLNDRQAADALNRALKLDSNAPMALAARKALDGLK